MSEERKENVKEKDINVNGPEYRAGYLQGFLDGIVVMGDTVREKLNDSDLYVKTSVDKGK